MESYDILTYLSDLGGLIEVSMAMGALFSALVLQKYFYAAVIMAAYKI